MAYKEELFAIVILYKNSNLWYNSGTIAKPVDCEYWMFTFSLLQLLLLLRLLSHQRGLVWERLSHQAVGSRVGG